MRTPRWGIALGLAAATTMAQAAELSIPHERYTLDNGLEVVLAQDNSAPIVHTQLWYHVGSKDEVEGLTGFAHLFEHLMFQGSENSPGEYFAPIQQVGGTLNGTTNGDRTNYFETVPSRYLPLALFMESDRMGALLGVLDQGKLDNQREVVRNERRQRYENRPYGEVWVDLFAAMYPEGHPYHHPTIGSHEDLENASLDDVKAFFGKWYVPNNATLVVVGDFEFDTARRLVEEQFGWIPSGPEPARRTVEPVVLEADEVIVQHDDVPDDKVWVAYHAPAFFQPGDAALDILSSLMCDGQGSRLHQALVKEQKVARDVSCFQYSRELQSVFLFEGTAAEGHTTEELVAAIDTQIASLLDDAPPTEAEIASAIADFEVGFYQQMETIAGKGGMLSRYLHYVGESDYVQSDLDRYLELTPADLSRTADEVFAGHRVALHVLPEPEEDASDDGGEE